MVERANLFLRKKTNVFTNKIAEPPSQATGHWISENFEIRQSIRFLHLEKTKHVVFFKEQK